MSTLTSTPMLNSALNTGKRAELREEVDNATVFACDDNHIGKIVDFGHVIRLKPGAEPLAQTIPIHSSPWGTTPETCGQTSGCWHHPQVHFNVVLSHVLWPRRLCTIPDQWSTSDRWTSGLFLKEHRCHSPRDLIDKTHDSKFFSHLDVKWSFRQVRLSQESIELISLYVAWGTIWVSVSFVGSSVFSRALRDITEPSSQKGHPIRCRSHSSHKGSPRAHPTHPKGFCHARSQWSHPSMLDFVSFVQQNHHCFPQSKISYSFQKFCWSCKFLLPIHFWFQHHCQTTHWPHSKRRQVSVDWRSWPSLPTPQEVALLPSDSSQVWPEAADHCHHGFIFCRICGPSSLWRIPGAHHCLLIGQTFGSWVSILQRGARISFSGAVLRTILLLVGRGHLHTANRLLMSDLAVQTGSQEHATSSVVDPTFRFRLRSDSHRRQDQCGCRTAFQNLQSPSLQEKAKQLTSKNCVDNNPKLLHLDSKSQQWSNAYFMSSCMAVISWFSSVAGAAIPPTHQSLRNEEYDSTHCQQILVHLTRSSHSVFGQILACLSDDKCPEPIHAPTNASDPNSWATNGHLGMRFNCGRHSCCCHICKEHFVLHRPPLQICLGQSH